MLIALNAQAPATVGKAEEEAEEDFGSRSISAKRGVTDGR